MLWWAWARKGTLDADDLSVENMPSGEVPPYHQAALTAFRRRTQKGRRQIVARWRRGSGLPRGGGAGTARPDGPSTTRSSRRRSTPISSSCGKFVFVRVTPQLWLRTHPCITLRDCPVCKAPKGEPCRGAQVPRTAQTHGARRCPEKWAWMLSKEEHDE